VTSENMIVAVNQKRAMDSLVNGVQRFRIL